MLHYKVLATQDGVDDQYEKEADINIMEFVSLFVSELRNESVDKLNVGDSIMLKRVQQLSAIPEVHALQITRWELTTNLDMVGEEKFEIEVIEKK